MLGAGATDEGRVVDKTVLKRDRWTSARLQIGGKRARSTDLRGVTLGLERTEERLLGSEDLDSRGGVLGEVGERTGVGDEPGANGLSEEGREVRGDEVHLLNEVRLEVLPVLGEVDDTVREVGDVDEVDRGDVRSHRGASAVKDVLGSNFVIVQDLLDLLEIGLGEPGFVPDELGKLSVLVVVGDEPDKLREVPAVPLADAHGERVNVLVKLVGEGDRLDDHVVRAVDVELGAGAQAGP